MQFEITDEAAKTFAREFYGAVADGYLLDAALAEARKAIFAQANSSEWGTPVLYLRAPDGRIFDVEAEQSERGTASTEERATSQEQPIDREPYDPETGTMYPDSTYGPQPDG